MKNLVEQKRLMKVQERQKILQQNANKAPTENERAKKAFESQNKNVATLLSGYSAVVALVKLYYEVCQHPHS